ncbi:MAG: hypothetical protein QMD06_00880 [Candidatus Altarchaeum sp.]|nr:hypothetical protein [Candidatus Altarchaeum sp.]
MIELVIALELKGNLLEDELEYVFNVLKSIYGFLWNMRDEAGDKVCTLRQNLPNYI